MKKLKPLYWLVIISIIIIVSVSGYHWWQNTNSDKSVGYISDSNWSQPSIIVNKIDSYFYKKVVNEQGLSLFWIREHGRGIVEELYAKKTSFKGQLLKDETLLVKDKGLRSFSVEQIGDYYHLFWLSGEKEYRLKLNYWKLDQDFQTVEKKVLLENMSYTKRIKSEIKDDQIYLSWLTSKKHYEQVEIAKFNLESKDLTARQVTGSELDIHANYPNMIFKRNAINLVWFQQNSDMLFKSDFKVKLNSEHVYFQRFDSDLKPLTDPILISDAAISSKISPELYYEDGNLHIIFSRYDKDVISEDKGTKLYHASLDYNSPNQMKLQKLTGEYTNYPSLVKKGGKYYLSYIDLNQGLSVKLVEMDKIEKTVEGKKLFSRQRSGTNLKLFKGPDDYLHQLWVQRVGTEDHLYYANTRYSEDAGVLEVLGIHLDGSPVQIITTTLYFFILPLFKIFATPHVTGIIFFTVLTLLMLKWVAGKFKFLRWLKKTNNTYISFLIVLGLIGLLGYLQGDFLFLFYPGPPPLQIIPFILGISTVAALFYINRINSNGDIAMIIGGLMGYIWFYWVIQANLIFYAYQYFI